MVPVPFGDPTVAVRAVIRGSSGGTCTAQA